MQKPDMSEVLNMYGIKLNRNKKAICPFHNEKTASLSIKGKIYNCFGCGIKGDSIDFVMKMERCDFKKTLEILRIGDSRETKQQKIQKKRQEKKNIKYWEAYKQFAKFDKFCTENKPKKYQEPTKGWYMCNEAREIWWEKLQKLK